VNILFLLDNLVCNTPGSSGLFVLFVLETLQVRISWGMPAMSCGTIDVAREVCDATDEDEAPRRGSRSTPTNPQNY
jgi:hypothetical protein